ncbi:vWA domain-containing protein [Antarcticirhabdus aurantiaca]|uniref:VWA domain-containing protein n=1 Tax=Antarcticirhabdus aurantiaca TaxID=2606717 RepID=A0ACD4NJE7_9HYPH|nr:VWA domain-containing protein [Antarcticirhabdus aurantiaca]WAJ26980.1 VWA domain-containing protein [Jeongeuplla avenae]
MTLFGDLTLLRPAWLLGLPLVALAAVYVWRRRSGLGAWEAAVDPAMMRALSALGRVVPGARRRHRAPVLLCALLALALVGPAVPDDEAPTFRNLDAVVLVMDLSDSVVTGGRFPAAQGAASFVAREAGSRPIALVVFAGDAYLASAFTTDAEALETTIAVLAADTVPEKGSRAERGLAMAKTLLDQAEILSGDVVLVSDGEGLSPAALREAERIAAGGSRVSTLFVEPNAAAAAAPPPDADALARLAEAGGGVAGSALAPAGVAARLAQNEAATLRRSDLVALLWHDYGRVLLAAAMLPALFFFRRERVT